MMYVEKGAYPLIFLWVMDLIIGSSVGSSIITKPSPEIARVKVNRWDVFRWKTYEQSCNNCLFLPHMPRHFCLAQVNQYNIYIYRERYIHSNCTDRTIPLLKPSELVLPVVSLESARFSKSWRFMFWLIFIWRGGSTTFPMWGKILAASESNVSIASLMLDSS